MEAILGIVGIAGMIGTVGTAGFDAGKSTDDLRKQIKDIKAHTATLKEKWETAIKAATALDQQEKDDIVTIIDQMEQTSAKARVAKRQFDQEYRKIQMYGIIFIVIIFFLLLLKHTGISDALQDLILSPFQNKKKKS